MAQCGPDGQATYTPHRAYSVIGRQLYGVHWVDGYSGKPSLPHLSRAKQLLKGAGKRSKELRALLAQGDDAYDAVQRRRYREAQAVRELLNALEWGKTHAWRRWRGRDWQPIDDRAWANDQDLRRALTDDIAVHWGEASIHSGSLLINKDRLDQWLPNVVPPLAQSPITAKQPNPIGRPGTKKNALKAELISWERAGKLPPLERGWREKVCRDLQQWYERQYPSDATPQTKTIKRILKPELDRIQSDANA